MAREIDSKNRQFHPDFITIFTPTEVVDGEGVSSIGNIQVDSHKVDLDDLSKGEHERYDLDLAFAVELEVITAEQAQSMEGTMRILLQNIDVMKQAQAQEPTE